MSKDPRGNEIDANAESQEQEIDRSAVAGPVWELKKKPLTLLSPISEIALTLGDTSIATPTTTKSKSSRIGEFQAFYSCCTFPRLESFQMKNLSR